MLKNAGAAGVRSDRFLAEDVRIPRVAARIKDLRDQGYAIEAEREDKFVRYYLSVGVGGAAPEALAAAPHSGEDSTGGLGPASESSGEPPALFERRVPSMFDADVSWEDAA
jgi:hypothetical protein